MFSHDCEARFIGVLSHTATASTISTSNISDVSSADLCRIRIQLHSLDVQLAAVTAFRSDIYRLLAVPISDFANYDSIRTLAAYNNTLKTDPPAAHLITRTHCLTNTVPSTITTSNNLTSARINLEPFVCVLGFFRHSVD